jgi:hypothetical protein
MDAYAVQIQTGVLAMIDTLEQLCKEPQFA